MSSTESYKAIRKNIVTLSLEIEDKEKLCEILKRKIESERLLLSKLESDADSKTRQDIETEISEYNEQKERLVDSSSELIERKRELMQQCSNMVESIKEEERTLAADVRNCYRLSENNLENAKKIFKIGYDEITKASKTKEIKDNTMKAMEPEVTRLQMMHESEIRSIEMDLEEEEKQLQEKLHLTIQSGLKEEENRAKSIMDQRLSEMASLQRSRKKQLEKEYEYKATTLKEEFERDIEKITNVQKMKARNQRELANSEVRALQSEIQQKMKELKAAHDDHIQDLQREHQMKCSAAKSLDETNFASTLADTNRDIMRAIDIGLADVEKEAQKDRDAAIQSEIRALEIQSLREERVWKSRLDSDYEQVRGAYEEEERLLNSKIAKNKSLMVDQLAVKHNLLKSVNEEKSLLRIKSNQLSDLQEEVKIFENGIIAQKDRINDVKASHDLRKRELEAAHKSMVNLIVGSCSKLESDIQESINHTNSNIKSLEFSHTQNLEELNLKVKQDLAQKDRVLGEIRDGIEAELLKKEHLQKLRNQYQKSTSGK